MTTVVAAVVARDGRYLLGRRPPEKRHGGLWEFPGGKVDPGESRADALRRELAEELGVVVIHVGDVRFSFQDDGAPFVIDFVSTSIDGDPEALEHSEVAWLRPNELRGLSLAPADARFASMLWSTEGCSQQ